MFRGQFILKIGAALAIASPLAFAQSAGAPAARLRIEISSSAARQVSIISPAEIVREIDDPSNGDRWLLVHNASHPAGPGFLLLASAAPVRATDGSPEPAAQPPIIHAGDRLILEENTAVVSAQWSAIALGPAWAGSPLNVRLTVGGKVLRAVAAAPGRAVLEEEASR